MILALNPSAHLAEDPHWAPLQSPTTTATTQVRMCDLGSQAGSPGRERCWKWAETRNTYLANLDAGVDYMRSADMRFNPSAILMAIAKDEGRRACHAVFWGGSFYEDLFPRKKQSAGLTRAETRATELSWNDFNSRNQGILKTYVGKV